MTSLGTVAVDLGKSLCRVRISIAGRVVHREGPGAPGLAARDGDRLALDAILALLEPRDPRAAVRIGVGAAGVLFAPDAGAAFATALSEAAEAPVAVASDVVTAHAGALGGEGGVLLVAGTGAVALGVDRDGYRSVDGWGPELGDLGSGSWIGREGVRAVLRARDGLAGPTALAEALARLIGGDETPIAWVGRSAAVPRLLATFAPAVLDSADREDPAALAIRDRAAELLADTARAAARPHGAVALHGGLMSHPGFRSAVTAALAARGLEARESRGDALDGAAMIAEGRAPLHERFVHRAG
ncbi:N-acetylglucosamine kinase [Microbacterium panaciterrae]|uniref:BadF/BadG/BcrA/BcrD ATPase family protein n=1 Tax=Microbacterium panaciterrae TaxID=985759 RepID=A0ABP8NYG3_9MICO